MPLVPINTASGTEFYDHWYAPNTEWPKLKPNWLKLPECYSFDLERMREQVYAIKNDYGFKPFVVGLKQPKKRLTYRGIGLTARPEAEDPLYDSLRLFSKEGELDIAEQFRKQRDNVAPDARETVELAEKQFSEPTVINTGYIAEVIGQFKSSTTKTRLLELAPRGIITSHVDFPYYHQIRVHAVIDTTPDVWWEVEGEKFQIPADGNFYWFDTGKYHAVWNDGKTDRIVLSVNLSVFEDRDGKIILGPDHDLVEMINEGLV
jgi:hypothetical protein